MDLLCKHRPTMMSILVPVPDNYQILDIEQPRLDQTKEIVHILNWHYNTVYLGPMIGMLKYFRLLVSFSRRFLCRKFEVFTPRFLLHCASQIETKIRNHFQNLIVLVSEEQCSPIVLFVPSFS